MADDKKKSWLRAVEKSAPPPPAPPAKEPETAEEDAPAPPAPPPAPEPEAEDSAEACMERFRAALRGSGVGFPCDRLSATHRLAGVSVVYREGEPAVPLAELLALTQATRLESEDVLWNLLRGHLGPWSRPGHPGKHIFSTHHGRNV